jgi:hypothetical protein
MTDKRTQQHAAESNMQKDPEAWVTGDEPMTGAQRSYLKTLSEEARQPFDDSLTKAQASQRIDELQAITGRGAHGGKPEQPGAGAPPADGSRADDNDPGRVTSVARAMDGTVLGEETDLDGGSERTGTRSR